MTQTKDTFPAMLPPEQPGTRMTLTMAPPQNPCGWNKWREAHPVDIATRHRQRANRERAALVAQSEGLAA